MSRLPSQWTTAPATYTSSTHLDLRIHNTTNVSLALTITLRSQGLNAQNITRAFATITLPAGSSSDVRPTIAVIPIQSVATQSALTLEMSWVDAGGVNHMISSPPLLYTFTTARYDHATIYDRFGQPALNQTPESYFGTNAAGLADVTDAKLGTLYTSIATTNTTLSGRYWTGSTWTTYTQPRTSYVGSTVAATGSIAKIIENQILGTHQPGLAGASVCFNWRVDWADEGFGLPAEAIQSNAGLFPARFARVAIFPSATPTSPLFSDYLDGNGCTTLPSSIPNGAYTVWMVARMQSGTTTAVVRDHICETSEHDLRSLVEFIDPLMEIADARGLLVQHGQRGFRSCEVSQAARRDG